jgi:hypothetical protein
MLRVALTTAGADASLNDQSMATLFNLSASTIHAKRLYDGGLSLPSKLPHARAKTLVTAMLDALNAARTSDAGPGGRVGIRLMHLPVLPMDAAIQADVTAVVTAVEANVTARLAAGGSSGGPSGGSSATSTRSLSPPPVPLPTPDVPTAIAVPVLAAVEATSSLAANVRSLLEGRLARPLAATEAAALTEALVEALGVLQSGGVAAQRALLDAPLGRALLSPSAAYVWATVAETAERDVSTVAAFGDTVVSAAATISGALFAATFD